MKTIKSTNSTKGGIGGRPSNPMPRYNQNMKALEATGSVKGGKGFQPAVVIEFGSNGNT